MPGRICSETELVLRMNKQENEAPGGGSDSITILGTDARQVQVPFMTKDFTDCRLSFEKHVLKTMVYCLMPPLNFFWQKAS